ncbi:MAG: alpha/beta hydrolase [Ignavibacteria bacterium]|nr:alpha/beta hydrolase [Ignavibacteria bacterium]
MNKNYVLNTSEGNKLNITTFGNGLDEEKSTIIFVHGFKGFKDWGFGPYLASSFSDFGFNVVTFNFSHNGVGDSLTEFVELDKFAANTFSLEISELEQVIEAHQKNLFEFNKNDKIFLLGHSRGGAIALLTVVKNRNVTAVVVWASIAKLDRYSERQKLKWRETGSFDIINTRTKQTMKLNVSLLDDIEANKNDLLNIEKAIREFNRELLIIHGEQDLAVPVSEAQLLYSWSDKSKTQFELIPNAGHTFDIKHPFEGSNQKFEKVISLTKDFLQKFN